MKNEKRRTQRDASFCRVPMSPKYMTKFYILIFFPGTIVYVKLNIAILHKTYKFSYGQNIEVIFKFDLTAPFIKLNAFDATRPWCPS